MKWDEFPAQADDKPRLNGVTVKLGDKIIVDFRYHNCSEKPDALFDLLQLAMFPPGLEVKFHDHGQ